MASALALQRAAQAWCVPQTEKKAMDTELAVAFADILDEEWERFKAQYPIGQMKRPLP